LHAQLKANALRIWEMLKLLQIFSFSYCLHLTVGEDNGIKSAENTLRILHSKFAKYNKDLRPDMGGDPVTVGVNVYILAVNSVSEEDMSFSIDMYFRQFWNDSRLAFEDSDSLEKIVFGAEKTGEIWKPDTFFVNENPEEYEGPATDTDTFLRIENDGAVLWSQRMSLTASCPMDLSYYPFDSQLCSLEIESFKYTMSDIKYKWQDDTKGVQLSPDVSYFDMNVLGHRARIVEANLKSGNYSRLIADIAFERASAYYVTHQFLPVGFLSLLSLAALLIPSQHVTGRLLLGIVPLLAIMYISMIATKNLPNLAYFKAIDIFMIFHCVLIAVSIILSIFFAWRDKHMKSSDESNKGVYSSLSTSSKSWLQAEIIFLTVFLIVFITFNIIFWCIYGGHREVVDDLVELF